VNTVVITLAIEKGYTARNAVGIYTTAGIGTVDMRL
tara:strand:+ start:273 stop:380 length:108 start_codon:yes stop_codon:yes gene_type:complete